jgi:type 1 glutamine amidotransferase
MVSWAWERPDGGRSFGFSGLHFHKNWSEPFYQRLMAQAVLWTVERTPPESNFPVKLSESDLQLDAK